MLSEYRKVAISLARLFTCPFESFSGAAVADNRV
jgi:hypothetical protein